MCLIKINHELHYIATCGEKWYTGSHSSQAFLWRLQIGASSDFKSLPKMLNYTICLHFHVSTISQYGMAFEIIPAPFQIILVW